MKQPINAYTGTKKGMQFEERSDLIAYGITMPSKIKKENIGIIKSKRCFNTLNLSPRIQAWWGIRAL